MEKYAKKKIDKLNYEEISDVEKLFNVIKKAKRAPKFRSLIYEKYVIPSLMAKQKKTSSDSSSDYAPHIGQPHQRKDDDTSSSDSIKMPPIRQTKEFDSTSDSEILMAKFRQMKESDSISDSSETDKNDKATNTNDDKAQPITETKKEKKKKKKKHIKGTILKFLSAF